MYKKKQRSIVADNNLTTLGHKLSNPDYLRQRWVVADPFEGYEDEAHYWYIPDDIPIRKNRQRTEIDRHDLKRERFMWPIKNINGKLLHKHERRSDRYMHDPGKPNPNHSKDSRQKFANFCGKNGISYSDIS